MILPSRVFKILATGLVVC